MSTNPERSRLARIATLLRQAQAAEAAGRVAEAVSLLQEVVRLDPRDRRTLHRLGDLFRIRLNRFREAGSWYARAARRQEEEGFHGRALALWRLVLRCDPALVEAYERIGALCVEMGHVADARLHYERGARELKEAGLVREAAILRAHLAALQPAEAERPATPPVPAAPVEAAPEPKAGPESSPDADALDLAADRLQNGRLFHHYGLQEQARQQLEELLASLPEHVEARQLLVEVCRALGDQEAAAQHLRALTWILRQQGEAATPVAEEHVPLPPVEEWLPEDAAADPLGDLMAAIREDVERVVEGLSRKEEEK